MLQLAMESVSASMALVFFEKASGLPGITCDQAPRNPITIAAMSRSFEAAIEQGMRFRCTMPMACVLLCFGRSLEVKNLSMLWSLLLVEGGEDSVFVCHCVPFCYFKWCGIHVSNSMWHPNESVKRLQPVPRQSHLHLPLHQLRSFTCPKVGKLKKINS